ncbi:hypothetical protein NITHO_6800002 [Nitrolancea hollandica Lb]|uniref:Uncharacterized protein n=1 Tax=Nitrolancea hollandica Lb TaxID=1129897 RepID=I4EMX8_9BACT|nr:hypothetical protein NITHO_6800002 [Nitrolancea hollandica Lb]
MINGIYCNFLQNQVMILRMYFSDISI